MLQSMRSTTVRYVVWIFVAIAFVVVFLLLDTSGLLGREQVTTSTVVGSVNGEDILYSTWRNAYERMANEQQQRSGRAPSLDEDRRIQEEAFNQIVAEILLEQEYQRRGIRVTDEEIIQAAQYMPPRELMQAPDFQTEGQFDYEKYRRFLGTPYAKRQGLLAWLESYYRSELPRQKLFEQIASGVYITDAELWRIYEDQHDSAQVTFVALRPALVADTAVSATDAEIRAYFDAHRKEFERPGRAVVSVISLQRVIGPEDTAATRARAAQLRQEILAGADFAEVAKRESADSGSAVQGGLLPAGGRGRFVPEFERAAYSLRQGQISEPVLTQFGYHLIRLEERRGDDLTLRHILLPIKQSDSAAVRVDRRADSLAALAAGATDPRRLDEAARTMGLRVERAVAFEGEPLTIGGRYIPSVSAWAFDGTAPGETSDLFEGEEGYFLARLDSLTPGGEPKLEDVRDEVRAAVLREKKLEVLVPRARQLSQAALGNSLERAAADAGLTATQSPMFNRVSFVPGLGRLNRAIGAAFGLPVGAVSAPIKTEDAVIVLRVDRRSEASEATFEEQKENQRATLLQQVRQQRVQDYIENLRESAKVKDRRKEINAAARRQQV